MKELPPEIPGIPRFYVEGDLQFFAWPKGVKKIVCEGFTITRVPHPTDRKRRKKTK